MPYRVSTGMSVLEKILAILPLHLITSMPDLYSIFKYFKIKKHIVEQERLEARR